jgi:hypothetical protein
MFRAPLARAGPGIFFPAPAGGVVGPGGALDALPEPTMIVGITPRMGITGALLTPAPAALGV